MDLSNLFSRMVILFIYIVVGFVAAKAGKMDADTAAKVNKVLLYIGQPALILSSVLNTELNMSLADVGIFFLLTCIMQLLLIVFALVFTPLFVKNRHDRGLFKFMISYGNVGFMGMPIIAALFGQGAIFMASIVQVPFFLTSYSIGVMQLKGRAKGEKINFRFLLNPALVSTFIAIVLFIIKLPIPQEVLDATSGLAGILVPLSMVVIGANLGMNKLSNLFVDWRMYVLAFIKLIASPVLVFLICGLFVKNEVYLGILVVCAAMPVAVLASMLSTEYGTDIQVASRGVFMTTLLSLITIPIMMGILF